MLRARVSRALARKTPDSLRRPVFKPRFQKYIKTAQSSLTRFRSLEWLFHVILAHFAMSPSSEPFWTASQLVLRASHELAKAVALPGLPLSTKVALEMIHRAKVNPLAFVDRETSRSS